MPGARFLVAENPDAQSTLPYLLHVPLEGGIALKARERWPISSRVYCHELSAGWPEDAQLLEEVAVRGCRRRGPAVDLLLDRPRNNRSQFVFTHLRGRPAIFWQTAKAARSARPGVRVPTRRAAGLQELTVAVDTRERYPYRFDGRPVERTRSALAAGDYAVLAGERTLGAVERKTEENFATSISDGSLAFQLADLATLPAAAVVVEGTYSRLLRSPHVEPGFLAELVARLQVRYPNVPIAFLESRKLAEEWTWRFLAPAAAEHGAEVSSPSAADG